MREFQEKIFELMQRATEQLEHKGYKQAEVLLRELLEIESNDAWGWCLLGSALEGQAGKSLQAINAFLKATEINPKLDWAQKRLDRLLSAREEDLEIPSTLPWMQGDEDNILNDLITQAKKCEDYGEYSGAKVKWEEVLELNPKITEARISIGHLVENYLGPIEDAEQYYTKALEIDPSHDWAWAKYGLFLKKRERFDAAEDAFRQAIELDHDYVIYGVWLGWLLIWSLDRPDEGGMVLINAMKNKPDYIWGQIQLGRYYAWVAEEATKAKKIFKSICEQDPQNKEALYQLGMIFHQIDQDYKKAYRFFRKVTDLDPNDFAAWRRIIDILNRIPDEEGVLEKAYHKIISLDPDIDDHYTELAILIAAQEGRGEEAEKYFKKAIEVNGDAEWAWANLGKLYVDQGRLDEGKAALETAVKIYPEYAWADYLIAMVHYDHWQAPEEAVKILQKAVKKAPASFFANYYMGLFYGEDYLDLPEKAYPFLVKALEIDPEAELVLLQLISICQLDDKTYDEATDYCRLLLDINDQDLENLLCAAHHYMDYIWDLEGAYGYIDKYLNLISTFDIEQKDYACLFAMQARCLSYMGHFDAAEALFEKAAKLEPDVHYIWHEFGEFIYKKRGDDQKALEYLTKANALEHDGCNSIDYEISYVKYRISEDEVTAKKDFAAALAKDDEELNMGYGRFLEKIHAKPRAIEKAYRQEMKQDIYNYVLYYQYAMFLFSLKTRDEEAQIWLDKAKSRYPAGFDMKLDLLY
jgi:tetratricopeptide (TPR) repeat protein